MESFGYEKHYQVLNSKEFGIPQSRNRVFVVSIRKDLKQKFSFDNLEKKKLPKLSDFLEDNVSDDYYIIQKSMIKVIENGKIKIVDNVVEMITTKQWRWNNSGVVKIPLTSFTAENVINDLKHPVQTITASSAQSRIKIAVPVFEMETKNFTNFITIPRESDGELINGSYNRVWKANKYVGTIAASKVEKVAISITDVPKENIPIFIIDNKSYHLRILTERECWRLKGWKDEDIDRVINMPKTHLYHMAGNAIVVQVLESIFKELLKGVV